jgi:crossover junction endodeoxyribonuclease RusA
MDEIKLILPFPPSNNQYYRKVNNNMVISERGKAYKKAVIEHLERTGMAGMSIDYPMIVRVELHQPDNRKRDSDNYLKGLFDALTNAKFWLDDSLVIENSVRLMPPINTGYTVVRIMPDLQSGFE